MRKEGTKAIDATAKVFCMAFDRLPRQEKLQVMAYLMETPSIREDLLDIALIEASRMEIAGEIPLRRYLKSRKMV